MKKGEKYINYVVDSVFDDTCIVSKNGHLSVRFPFRGVNAKPIRESINSNVFYWNFVSYIATKYACNSHYGVVYEKYILRVVDEMDSLPIIR
jgi:hypothetical protein